MAPPRQGTGLSASSVSSLPKGPPQRQTTAASTLTPGPTLAKPAFKTSKAEALYDMLESQASSSNQTYAQSDLLALPVVDSAQELMPICQELVNLGLFQLLTSDGNVCYRLKSQSDASKIKSLDNDARIIYNTIEAAGTAGIWTKTLKGKTNLHQTVLTRSLKMLENKSYVKQVRNSKYPGRKIYMLKNLNPTDEVTGGPWYSDGELDQDLINIISDVVLKYVERKSWRPGPRYKKPSSSISGREVQPVQHMISESDRILLPQAPGYTGYPVASEILTFIDSNDLVRGKNIELPDLQTLLDVLVFDRKLEVVGPSTVDIVRSKKRRRRDVTKRRRQEASKPRKRTATLEADEDDTVTRPAKRRAVRPPGLDDTPAPRPVDDDDDDYGENEQYNEEEDEEDHAPTRASAPTIDDEDADSGEDEDDPDPFAEPEQMFRSVRRAGYPPPSAHDAASPAPATTTNTTATTTTNGDGEQSKATATAGAATAADSKHRDRHKHHRAPAVHPGAQRASAYADTPCARCPVFRLCEEGGPVDASSCGYFAGWLAGGAAAAAAAATAATTPVVGAGVGTGVGDEEVDFTAAGGRKQLHHQQQQQQQKRRLTAVVDVEVAGAGAGALAGTAEASRV